jgi:Cdc6-like AAA superfamily ATPase
MASLLASSNGDASQSLVSAKISFDDHAFDRHLVMSDEVQKRMLLGLVSQYFQDPKEAENVDRGNNTTEVDVVQSIDPIFNKVEGCIFLCCGPPGTGKTLTAKSVAEKLHRPLWAVSASELSSEVDKLDKSWTSHPPGVRFSCLMKQTSIWRGAIRLVIPNATP